jgi:hypothetical protein
MRVTAAIALTLTACAVGDASRPVVDENACYASGQVVAETLSAVMLDEPMPAECWALLDTTVVSYVTEMPCTSDQDGRVIGCSFNPPNPRILLLDAEGVTNEEHVDIAAHEWLHLLAECALGDSDPKHTKPILWGKGLDAVLGLALAAAPTGPCM